jgi:hypothetical protein
MRYRNADLGFDPAHILSVHIGLPKAKYQGRDPLSAFYQPLEERVNHLPGVQAAGLINVLPIERSGYNTDMHIAGQPPYPPNQEMLSEQRFVSTGYFDAMGIPLHRGRRLSRSQDHPEDSAQAVVVNDAFVRKFIPQGLDPTAQRIDSYASKQCAPVHLRRAACGTRFSDGRVGTQGPRGSACRHVSGGADCGRSNAGDFRSSFHRA